MPMRYKIVMCGSDRVRKLVPAISNLIFVNSTRETLTRLKTDDKILEPLRYMMRRPVENEGRAEIIVVPDRQMENFMNVCRRVDDERVQYLRYEPFLDKPGRRVRIVDGNFAGIEGVIKRIKKNKQIVVTIPGIAAVTLNSIPYTWLEPIDE